MKTTNSLRKAIQRSNKAYELYIEAPVYLQALRIYEANQEVYALLLTYYYEEDIKDHSLTLQYIYHLEDWFHQFVAFEESNGPALEDNFVFIRLKNAIPYPKEFITSLD